MTVFEIASARDTSSQGRHMKNKTRNNNEKLLNVSCFRTFFFRHIKREPGFCPPRKKSDIPGNYNIDHSGCEQKMSKSLKNFPHSMRGWDLYCADFLSSKEKSDKAHTGNSLPWWWWIFWKLPQKETEKISPSRAKNSQGTRETKIQRNTKDLSCWSTLHESLALMRNEWINQKKKQTEVSMIDAHGCEKDGGFTRFIWKICPEKWKAILRSFKERFPIFLVRWSKRFKKLPKQNVEFFGFGFPLSLRGCDLLAFFSWERQNELKKFLKVNNFINWWIKLQKCWKIVSAWDTRG